jgi:anti-anti-sigma factor
MNITHSEAEHSINVTLKGELTFKDHTQFNDFIGKLNVDKRAVTFDLSDLTMIDSAGIGMLFLAQKIVQKHGGELTLSKPTGQVKRIFDITCLDQQIKIA